MSDRDNLEDAFLEAKALLRAFEAEHEIDYEPRNLMRLSDEARVKLRELVKQYGDASEAYFEGPPDDEVIGSGETTLTLHQNDDGTIRYAIELCSEVIHSEIESDREDALRCALGVLEEWADQVEALSASVRNTLKAMEDEA